MSLKEFLDLSDRVTKLEQATVAPEADADPEEWTAFRLAMEDKLAGIAARLEKHEKELDRIGLALDTLRPGKKTQRGGKA